jgi:hypothetical protein
MQDNNSKSDSSSSLSYLSMSEDSEPTSNIQFNKSPRHIHNNKKTMRRSYSELNNYKQIDSEEESDFEKNHLTNNNKRSSRENKNNKSYNNTILSSLSLLTNQLKTIGERLENLENSHRNRYKKNQSQELANRS